MADDSGRAVGEAGDLQVEIHGLDVYDPTTGVVRSDSTDDIACWFIDTAYDEQQFFVGHAYSIGYKSPEMNRDSGSDAGWPEDSEPVARVQ